MKRPTKKKTGPGEGRERAASKTGKGAARGATKKASARKKPARGAAKRKAAREARTAAGTRPGESGASEGESPEVVVVGVGASAGGLEAFTQLLEYLPGDTGMAFMLIQHLDPRQKSNLVEILSRATEMPVAEAADGLRLEADHVYVSPASMDVASLHGALHLMPRPAGRARHVPIDSFFRALAEDRGSRSVGVVLSGTGSDGALGLGAIKAEGGITFAQDQQTAKYGGMPASAVATGHVDFVLPPARIAEELAHVARHPHVRAVTGRRAEAGPDTIPEEFQKIFILLRRATGVDFSYYKRSTVERRVARRMVLHKIDSLPHYVKYAQDNPSEVSALFDDMLINVTGFFRDPETFEALKERVFPRIRRGKPPEVPIRIWVPGCSTGEEAYSIAIALVEHLEAAEIPSPIQVFATDVSEAAVEKARVGLYPESIVADVSPERLRRFFSPAGREYQISKLVRDMCIFARQDVTKDPPFSQLDLLSCRNLLIYLGPVLQERVIPVFHYALKPGGFLMLGTSETIGGFADLFALVDRKQKIYVKKAVTPRLPVDLSAGPLTIQEAAPRRRAGAAPLAGLQKEADQIVLARYGPPGVVVNDQLEILHFRGKTGRYLEPASGEAALSLLKMARNGLLPDLRASIHKAQKQGRAIRKERVKFAYDGEILEVAVEVIPLSSPETEQSHFLILFHEAPPPPAPRAKETARRSKGSRGRAKDDAQQEAGRLEQELATTKETLQTIIEEYESTNEELRAASEEVQSANEELQSTNEELETAKEELQSTNEELTTLNEELENRNDQLTQAIDDLDNLLNSVDIPMLILDGSLRIRRLTPTAERILKLIPADVGRPICDLRLGLEVESLKRQIREVIDTLGVVEEVVRRDNGRWYAIRIRPYRTTDNRIAGAVLAFIDITERKLAEDAVEDGRLYAESIVATVREPLLVLDDQLRIVSANHAFYTFFQTGSAETEKRLLYDLGGGEWDIPRLRELLEEIIPKDAHFHDFEVDHHFPRIGRKRMLLNARRIDQTGQRPMLILLAMEEAADRERGEG